MSLEYEIYKEGGLLNGKYQKLEDISEGSYGVVSLAKDITKARLVAVKYIFKYQDEKSPKKESRYSQSLKNFTERMDDDICEEALHEIDIHHRLGHHENIVSFIDCFESFIILEYCSRGDLYEAIKANIGPTSTRDIVNVTLQLIGAVEFAHSKSIYHRDIKPENILIADDFSIRLSDWGLATDKRICTDFGVGSERYMAPELFDELNLDCYDAAKCDIWSIGICLLNIVFHKNPFTKANESDKSFSYFARNREALFDIFSTMSDDLFSVLRHCLTLDPDNRYLSLVKEELLKVQKLTIDEDLDQFEKEMSKSVSAKPIAIRKTKAPRSKNIQNGNAKSFAIPTPNTHIAKQFQDFKREQFNRRDFFTPPSVNAHYLEKFGDNRRYQPPHQKPNTPKLNSQIPRSVSPSKKSRKSSFNSYSSSASKYVPPSLRSPNVAKSPLQQAVSLSDLDSDDDGLFVLEEHDTPNRSDVDLANLGEGINSLGLDERDVASDFSSAPSLISPVPLYEQRAHAFSENDRRPNSNDREGHGSNSDGSGTHPKKYVPPHHRENYQGQIQAWHSTSKKPAYWNQYNGRGRRHSGRREAMTSTSVPIKKTDWFVHSKIDGIEDDVLEDEEDDFEKSDFYKNFASRVGRTSGANFSLVGNDGKNRMLPHTMNGLNSVILEHS